MGTALLPRHIRNSLRMVGMWQSRNAGPISLAKMPWEKSTDAPRCTNCGTHTHAIDSIPGSRKSKSYWACPDCGIKQEKTNGVYTL